MSEVELLIQLEQVTARRRETEAYTEEWAALCYEMGRLTAAIWRVRRERKKVTMQNSHYTGTGAKEFTESLTAHIAFVREAGRKLGVPDEQLAVHDDSKWTDAEFSGYARHFHGGGAPDEFSKAWLHHLHHNPHHWQHWIFPDGYSPRGSKVESGVVEMPQYYALEMIADWMGASRAYTGFWDMQKWLYENMPKIRLHSATADFLQAELDHLGYADTVYVQKFAHE